MDRMDQNFSIKRSNRRKRKGTTTIFVEFERKEDGERFLKHCGTNQDCPVEWQRGMSTGLLDPMIPMDTIFVKHVTRW
ncbi:hypothetical protein DAPPUDRAFT_260396 [Daphnia pulex]|uniref:Uncharacterized protein n=1 Tax=Daphnia pulex TaxID=6669 RepID=E9HJ34_DAPPU|nr:hypothetical protein DAPPUDRAFT_260396 [Daphnia pulex]|eukprot:EFX68250.1 hypothetical protein DAPPUDRAFT_260396 [Daphnia pulex]